MNQSLDITYVETCSVVIVYYTLQLKYLFGTVTAPCIVTVEEWLNQGGE